MTLNIQKLIKFSVISFLILTGFSFALNTIHAVSYTNCPASRYTTGDTMSYDRCTSGTVSPGSFANDAVTNWEVSGAGDGGGGYITVCVLDPDGSDSQCKAHTFPNVGYDRGTLNAICGSGRGCTYGDVTVGSHNTISLTADLSVQEICNEPSASNYNGAGDCRYDQDPPPPPVCKDSTANNYNVGYPCTYNPPPQPGSPPPPPVTAPRGNLDATNYCSTLEGWAYDPDTPSTSIDVHTWDTNSAGSFYLLMTGPNKFTRPDVNAAFGLTGTHGFRFITPNSVKDSTNHTLTLWAIDSANGGGYQITGSPRVINCAIPPPTNLVTSCPAPGDRVYASWTAPAGGGLNTFYLRTHPGANSWVWPSAVIQDNVVGTSSSFPATPGQTYHVWVHTKHPNNALWSTEIRSNVDCYKAPLATYTLTTSIGSGSGTITGPGINCPGDCTHTYPQGTYVSLTATGANSPAPGYVVDKWIPNDRSLCGGGSGSICGGFIDGNRSAQVNFKKAPASPEVTSVTISSPVVKADGGTQYNIVMTGFDPSGGGNITHEYALINYQGSNAGSYRGHPTWYYDGAYTGWNSLKNKQSCAGGGIAAIQAGYGESYMVLDACSTSVSGNTRTVTFTVHFNPSFTTPITNNDISGYVHNADGIFDGWDNFDINFSLYQTTNPTLDSVTISSPVVRADGNTQYNIQIKGSDPKGGDRVTHTYTYINYQGDNAGSYRGQPTWYYNAAYTGWTGVKNKQDCVGGGIAALHGDGNEHTSLIACNTFVSGNQRTTTFAVVFHPSYTTPVNNNDISGYVQNIDEKTTGWINSDINFSLFQNFAYTLTSPGTLTITKKSSGMATGDKAIIKTRTAGVSEPVRITATGMPSGVTPRYDANRNCTPNCTSNITFEVAPNAPVGTHSITVTGVPAGGSTSFNLEIRSNPLRVSDCSATPGTAYLNSPVVWDADATGGTPNRNYVWRDGSTGAILANTESFTHRYSTIGRKRATVTVTDDDGQSFECRDSVNIIFDPALEEF